MQKFGLKLAQFNWAQIVAQSILGSILAQKIWVIKLS